MAVNDSNSSCCDPQESPVSCCKVESIISIDERGQMVLPKEVREKAGIRAGDKMALISWEKDGKVCCFSLIAVEEFNDIVKGRLKPLMQEVL